MMRKSEIKRTPFAPTMPKPAKGPRQKKCAHCREPFTPRTPLSVACSVDCAVEVAAAARLIAERKTDKVRKLALKTRQDWLREAQAAFNAFIRARDAELGCISCGQFHDRHWDAGHYRSVGAQPALRFDENNVHKQCVHCNQHRGGNIVEYRIRLVQKIGQSAVELLEIEHAPAKYSIEDAQRIKAVYKAKLKALTEAAAS